MNIKFFAYGIAAVIIGFIVMMLPLALETGLPSNKIINPWAWEPYSSVTEGENGSRFLDNTGTSASQPYSITSSSLILLTGLVIAFTVYILFKRQLRQQPTASSS